MCSNVSQSQKFCTKRILIQWTQVTTVSYRPMTNVVRSADKSQWTHLREFIVSYISADTICFRNNVMLLKNKANIIDFQPAILFHKATFKMKMSFMFMTDFWVYTRPISLGDFGRIFLSLLLTAATFIYQKYSNISHTVKCYLYFKLLFSVWKHSKIFSVTWSFRNHSDVYSNDLFSSISFYWCSKQFCCLIFLWNFCDSLMNKVQNFFLSLTFLY